MGPERKALNVLDGEASRRNDMQVQRFDPFTVLARMDRELDDLVRRGFATRDKAPTMAGFVPAVEVVREGVDVVVRVELPGVDVERDVAIEVDKGKLVISGERRDDRREQAGADQQGVLVRELRYGQFRREFALPPGVSPEQVEASYDAGLLDVRVRGVVQPEPVTVRVPITTRRPAGPHVVEAAPEADAEPVQA
jgi:HSP20 family protein